MAAVINIKTRSSLPPSAFTAGSYLWWGSKDKHGGYPIQVIASNFDKGTFSYIALNSTDPVERLCQISHPDLQRAQTDEVAEYVALQLMKLEPDHTVWSLIRESFSRLRKQLRDHREDKKLYKAFKIRMKAQNLL